MCPWRYGPSARLRNSLAGGRSRIRPGWSVMAQACPIPSPELAPPGDPQGADGLRQKPSAVAQALAPLPPDGCRYSCLASQGLGQAPPSGWGCPGGPRLAPMNASRSGLAASIPVL